MKKILLILSIFLLPIFLFASDEYSVALGIRNNNQTDNSHYFLLEGETDKFSVTLMENGGEYISLDTRYKGKFSRLFDWNTGTVFNHFSSGATTLMVNGNVNGRYGTESVNLSLGLGVQGAVLKYKDIDQLLFSISPLVNISINLKAEENSFSFGFMMDMKYERQFKAVETFFIIARRDFSPSFAMSLEFWGRGAEYLMDPWLNFQSGGLVLKFTLKDSNT